MAYNSDNMGIFANASETIHAYTTTDSLATIMAASYFNGGKVPMRTGDIIMAKTAAGGSKMLKVINTGGDITTEDCTEFATLNVGAVGVGNYTTIAADGSIQSYGNATCWEDRTFPSPRS